VVLISLLVTSCGTETETADHLTDVVRGPDVEIVIPAGEPIVVGVSTALTGAIGQRGSEYRDAVAVGVKRWREANGDLIGGHEIVIRAEDDGCTETDVTTVAALRHLQRAGLVGVIGPQCSDGVSAVQTIYAEAGVVAISGGATRTDLTTSQSENGYFFRTAFRNDLQGAFIALFISAGIAAEAVYFIDDGSLYATDLADAGTDLVEAAGITVTRVQISRGDVDFSELAAAITAADPDFVAFAGFNPEAALLYRQLRDAGYDGLFGAGDGVASKPNFVDPVGDAAEGVLFAGCRYPLAEDVLADFAELYDREPSSTFVAQYIDAVTILLDAVSQVAEERPDGSLAIKPMALRDAISETHLTDGVSGAFAFDASGDRVPKPGDVLDVVVRDAFEAQDQDVLVALGMIQCQVQDGELVPLAGPHTEGNIRR
jgi:branched-chain amino acid transport system substrate-binding protein